ncbi:MAG: thioesterase, partial [Rectinemataceae bacterium]|nr:thioesterase [Rectinemataceae bacterium]
MPIVEPYRLEYTVRGYDCGYGGPLKVLALTNFFQEAAGNHAAWLGIGMEALAPQGRTWMLSRIDLRMDRSPAAGDRVEVLTWPAGTKGIFALRDLVMRDSVSHEVLVRAVYAYLVVDVAARKPLRPDRCFNFELPRGADPHPVPDFDFSIPREDPDSGGAVSFKEQASPRHIDPNGHVNNAFILDWLADAVPRECRGETGRIGSMKVEFAAELLEGDLVEARISVLRALDEGYPLPGQCFNALAC